MPRKLISSYKIFNTKQYRAIFLLYFVFFLANGPLEGSVAILVNYYGFSEHHYGIFLSFATFTFIFTPTIVAFISNKIDPHIIGVIGGLIGFASSLIIGLNLFGSWIIFLFIYGVLITRDIFNFSIGNKINASIDDSNRSKYFSLRDLFLYGSISLGFFIGGVIADQLSITFFYLLFSFLLILSGAVILYMKKQKTLLLVKGKHDDANIDNDNPEDEEKQSESALSNNSKFNDLKKLVKQKSFIGFVLIDPLTSFYTAVMRFIPLFGLQLGLTATDLMMLVGILTFINAVFGLILGHYFETARKSIFILDLAIDILPAVLFAFTNSIELFIIAYTISILRGMLSSISFAYFFDCFTEKDAGTALGLLTSVGNITSTIMPALVGLLWLYSATMVFLLSAIAMAMASFIAIAFLPKVKNIKEVT